MDTDGHHFANDECSRMLYGQRSVRVFAPYYYRRPSNLLRLQRSLKPRETTEACRERCETTEDSTLQRLVRWYCPIIIILRVARIARLMTPLYVRFHVGASKDKSDWRISRVMSLFPLWQQRSLSNVYLQGGRDAGSKSTVWWLTSYTPSLAEHVTRRWSTSLLADIFTRSEGRIRCVTWIWQVINAIGYMDAALSLFVSLNEDKTMVKFLFFLSRSKVSHDYLLPVNRITKLGWSSLSCKRIGVVLSVPRYYRHSC
jgi:hypothetical protein